jgi:uncharacterized protein (DUF1015 family)
MTEIRAFRGYRYDLGHVGSLSDVVAPPYDVIDPTLQELLYAKSPYNVVRLILNKEEASDTAANNRYTRAQQFLRDWQREGVITQDSTRALYVCEQEFEIDRKRRRRRGFFARVRLEPFGQGKIFPHEETMPGPKADRLQLFHSTKMNLSPIFGLYPDEDKVVQSCLDDAVGRALPLEAMDQLGVTSRLWAVTNQQVVSAVTGLMGPRPLFIADGHHRYETALHYRDESLQASGGREPEGAFNFVLMFLVSMNDPGLIILPTHRLVSGIGDMSADRLRRLLASYFRLEVVGSGELGAREAWDRIEADGTQQILGFGTARDEAWLVGQCVAEPSVMQALAASHSQAWRALAVSVLQELILGQVLTKRPGYQPQCRYVHLLGEVIEAQATRACELAVLVPPVTMGDVAEIAGHLEKMPPKSTYFYPKILSGLVFNSLL